MKGGFTEAQRVKKYRKYFMICFDSDWYEKWRCQQKQL